jgi:ribosomal protein L29
MKYKELSNQSEAALKKQLGELQAEVEQLTIKLKLDQVKNRKQLGAKRKDIARVLTALRANM